MANKNIVASKADAVEKLSKQMNDAKSYFLCEYAGLTVFQLEELRKELRKNDCCLKVVTNNVIKRSFEKLGFKEFKNVEGPTCLVLSNTESVDGPKATAEFQKKNKKLVIKDGVVDGQYCSHDEIIAISALPSKMGLLSMLAGGMYQPLQQLALGLNMIANGENK